MARKQGAQSDGVRVRGMMNKYSIWIAVVIYAAVGFCMILFPDMAEKIVVYGAAALLAGIGLYLGIAYLRNPPAPNDVDLTLAEGLSLLTLGVAIAVWPGSLMALLIFLCCAAMIGGCYCKLQMALDAKRWGAKHWWYYLIGAFISLVMGLVIIPMALNRVVLGGMMIAEACVTAASLLVGLWMRKRLSAKPAAEHAPDAAKEPERNEEAASEQTTP